ncbi:hypothetical protein [Pseudoalteromonas luteoviolacea]|nr:hypothetical protein [Pseudoalteromonas luteoviolacea]
MQSEQGVKLLLVGEFAWYDDVSITSFMVGVIP